MAGCGGCGNCRGKCSKKSGWTPVGYYIMYEVCGYVGMGNWESARRVKILRNIANEKQAKIEAGKWLREMRKKEAKLFKLKSARLVVSVHKDILELI